MAAQSPELNFPERIIGRRATEVLAAYRVVIFSTDTAYVEYPAAQFDFALGVTRTAAATIGDMVDVVLGGVCLVTVDGAAANIVAGDSLTTHDATGILQKHAGGAAARRPCIGIALASSTADGDVIPMLISHHSVYYAS